MARDWGFLHAEDNNELDQVSKPFVVNARSAKNAVEMESHVREFMRKYLSVGDDPTDTLIRDRVWVFLRRHTKRHINEAALDVVWRQEMRRTSCVIV
jgi:hypothetical protein